MALPYAEDVFDLLDEDDHDDNNNNNEEDAGAPQDELSVRRTDGFDTLFELDELQSELLDDDDDDDDKQQEAELSQRLSQVSTVAVHDNNNDEEYACEPSDDGKRRRRRRLPDVVDHKRPRTSADDPVPPDYLLPTQPWFDQMLRATKAVSLRGSLTDADIDQLQRFACLTHHVATADVHEQLWSTYWRVGTTESVDAHPHSARSRWPDHVRSLLGTVARAAAAAAADDDEQQACERLVQDRLQHVRARRTTYETACVELRRLWTETMPELVDAIGQLVERHGIAPLRMKVQLKIALFEHERLDRALEQQCELERPTVDQQRSIKRLCELHAQWATAKGDLTAARHSLLCNRPPTSYDVLDVPLPAAIGTLENGPVQQHLRRRHEHLIQQAKTDLMALHIAATETRIAQQRTLCDRETDQLWQDRRRHHRPRASGEPRRLSATLVRLIEQRTANVHAKLATMMHFFVEYNLRQPYGRWEKNAGQPLPAAPHAGFQQTLIVDATTNEHAAPWLTDEQRRLLNRGPTYVPPGQMHIAPSLPTIDDVLRKQYEPLQRQMTVLLDKYHIDLPRREHVRVETLRAFRQTFVSDLPAPVLRRARDERQHVRALRSTLARHDLILRRTADHTNTFYLGPRRPFDGMATAYMNTSEQFTLLLTVDELTRAHIGPLVDRQLRSINSTLDSLHKSKRLTDDVYQYLQLTKASVRLPHLYFLPDVSAAATTTTTTTVLDGVQPMITTYRSLTSKLARHLQRLLAPPVRQGTASSTFVDEADLMQKLHRYVHVDRRLSPTTLFATVTMSNFHTMASHGSMVATLGYFLSEQLATNKLQYTSFVSGRPQWVSIDTLLQLVDLFLEHNVFSYENKIYVMTRGAPAHMPLTDTLATIYDYLWQKTLSADTRLIGELFGR